LDFNLTNWFYVFARAGALFAVFPAFSAQNIPVRLRLGLAAVLAFLSAPLLPLPAVAANPTFWTLLRLLFGEVSIGLLLGFVSRLIFFAIDLAGGIIATEMGLMLSAVFNPLTSSALPLPGTILFWLGMMLLFSLNLHHWILAAFQHSYALLPVGGAHLSEALVLDVVQRTAEIFRIGLQLAAPVLAVSFVISLLFAVLSRAVPQMNVFTESFAVRSLVGLSVFGLTCHLMAEHLENYLRRLPDDMLRVAHLISAGG
jgi:flagellar biosynthesis protein FliR